MFDDIHRKRLVRSFDSIGSLTVEKGWPRPDVNNEGGQIHAENIVLHPGTRLWAHKGGVLTIGDGTHLHRGTEVIAWENVRIGKNCMIGWDVAIMDTDLHPIGDRPMKNKPVVIGDNVCIGCRSIILKGVTVGEGAVIAAGSIVTKNVAPHSVVGGEPAREVANVNGKKPQPA
jgi:acetyltransferase-like isoleucine patch superfamily enzyme